MQNIHINHLVGRVKALNIGVADRTDEISFTAGLDTVNHALAPGENSADWTKVKVLPLDVILQADLPALIKIDVEGMETLVMRGMRQTLALPSLHSIIIELNGSGQRYGFDETEIIKTLRDYGFSPYHYDPFQRALSPLGDKKRLPGNSLFLRQVDLIQNRIANAPTFTFGLAKI